MADRLLIRSREICTEQGLLDGYLLVEEGRLAAIGAGEPPEALSGAERIDATESRVIPGMIDLHIHGAGGWAVEGGGPGGLKALARYLAAFGTTGYLPTASARSLPELEAMVAATRDAMQEPDPAGAAILGAHLEGPFLNPAQKGAMNPALFRRPSVPDMLPLLERSAGTIRRVTLAPELEGASELIRFLVDRGVAVAGGHTDATYDQARIGIEAGISISNHTYNAMRGLHHREPGSLGAYLLDHRVICEAICDLLHVHPAALSLVLRVAGRDRVAVISDAIPAAGMPEGRYQSFGRDLFIDQEGFSKLANGTISGSTRLMIDGLRNLVEVLGVKLEDACHMAGLVPARAIGLAHRKGSLAPGKDADLVIIDSAWKVQWSLVEGRVVRRPGDPPPQLNPEFLAARVSTRS